MSAPPKPGHRVYRQSPARWRGQIAQILPARKRLSRGHHKALAYEALPAFMAKLRGRGAVAALALEFAILTATRTGEVIGGTWAEVDLAKAVWTIPAARMKARKSIACPSRLAQSRYWNCFARWAATSCFPLQGAARCPAWPCRCCLRRMAVDVTVHGFRSAFRDWAAECTGYAHEVCEMALAHVIGNKAEAAYRRGDLFDKRARLYGRLGSLLRQSARGWCQGDTYPEGRG